MSGGCLHNGYFNNGYFNNGYFNTLNSKKNIIALTNQETTNRVLLSEESGSIITIDSSINTPTNINITLPSINQVGCEYTIIFLTHMQHASAKTIITTGDNNINISGYFNFLVAGGESTTGFLPLNISKLTIGNPTESTSLSIQKLISISSNTWYIESIFPNMSNLGANAAAESLSNTIVVYSNNI
jgi:hypothetical protein